MVDAVNLLLVEMPGHFQVDVACGVQIGAQRFFQHHPRLRIHQTAGMQLGANLAEQVGRGGQVKHPQTRLFAQGLQGLVIRAARDIDADIVQAFQKGLPVRAVQRLLVNESRRMRVDKLAVFLA